MQKELKKVSDALTREELNWFDESLAKIIFHVQKNWSLTHETQIIWEKLIEASQWAKVKYAEDNFQEPTVGIDAKDKKGQSSEILSS